MSELAWCPFDGVCLPPLFTLLAVNPTILERMCEYWQAYCSDSMCDHDFGGAELLMERWRERCVSLVVEFKHLPVPLTSHWASYNRVLEVSFSKNQTSCQLFLWSGRFLPSAAVSSLWLNIFLFLSWKSGLYSYSVQLYDSEVHQGRLLPPREVFMVHSTLKVKQKKDTFDYTIELFNSWNIKSEVRPPPEVKVIISHTVTIKDNSKSSFCRN